MPTPRSVEGLSLWASGDGTMAPVEVLRDGPLLLSQAVLQRTCPRRTASLLALTARDITYFTLWLESGFVPWSLCLDLDAIMSRRSLLSSGHPSTGTCNRLRYDLPASLLRVSSVSPFGCDDSKQIDPCDMGPDCLLGTAPVLHLMFGLWRCALRLNHEPNQLWPDKAV
ncbi:hypothetical protein BJV74DRAFT_302591 [Russula compacta]|nr:hypothetical protein BJV74DRAFT_302591 [Russula compacta]